MQIGRGFHLFVKNVKLTHLTPKLRAEACPSLLTRLFAILHASSFAIHNFLRKLYVCPKVVFYSIHSFFISCTQQCCDTIFLFILCVAENALFWPKSTDFSFWSHETCLFSRSPRLEIVEFDSFLAKGKREDDEDVMQKSNSD